MTGLFNAKPGEGAGLELFRESAGRIITPGQPDAAGDATYLKAVRDHLAKSKTGAALLKWADAHGVKTVVDHQITDKLIGLYLEGPNTVLLAANRPVERAAVGLGHELRHAWQAAHGLIPNANGLPLEDMVIKNRLLEADAATVHTQIAAELKYDAGDDTAWEIIRNSRQGDMINAYEETYETAKQGGLDAAARLDACKAAFDAWMNGEPRLFYDARLQEHRAAMKNTQAQQQFAALAAESPLAAQLAQAAMKKGGVGVTKGIDYTSPAQMNLLSTLPDGSHYLPHYKDRSYLADRNIFGIANLGAPNPPSSKRGGTGLII